MGVLDAVFPTAQDKNVVCMVFPKQEALFASVRDVIEEFGQSQHKIGKDITVRFPTWADRTCREGNISF